MGIHEHYGGLRFMSSDSPRLMTPMKHLRGIKKQSPRKHLGWVLS
ncbi:MAG TPA: hypothetical protein PKV48_04605 [Thermodesulfobacteriota bacterium]|nr:hypothetical protein [Thermodesulfobacteriota bacterium]